MTTLNDHADALVAQILAQPFGIAALVGDQSAHAARRLLLSRLDLDLHREAALILLPDTIFLTSIVAHIFHHIAIVSVKQIDVRRYFFDRIFVVAASKKQRGVLMQYIEFDIEPSKFFCSNE
ncbi:hypothetical protein ABZT49_15195 [Methylobacterium sp. EM32]|uniref:hypothetical protein n=1 Tax=Methylobacterium sp. EM32 TaxID=3163481 RepID=UPI00339EE6CE